MGDLSEHFSRWEFKCKCGDCDYDSVDVKTLEILEKIRNHFNCKVTILSGHRCPKHNWKIGGVDDSQHLKAKAEDIIVETISPEKVYQYANSIMPGWGGVGLYKTKKFVHVDIRQKYARWTQE